MFVDSFRSVIVGDAAVQLAARRIEAQLRQSDTVSRHSGDEFLVLLAEIMHPSDAATLIVNADSAWFYLLWLPESLRNKRGRSMPSGQFHGDGRARVAQFIDADQNRDRPVNILDVLTRAVDTSRCVLQTRRQQLTRGSIAVSVSDWPSSMIWLRRTAAASSLAAGVRISAANLQSPCRCDPECSLAYRAFGDGGGDFQPAYEMY